LRRVLLLEAGPDFPQEETVPPLFTFSGEHHWRGAAGIPEFDWDLANTDGAGTLGGRSLRVPRGRLVGGASMANATIAARGAPLDFDRWPAMGIGPTPDLGILLIASVLAPNLIEQVRLVRAAQVKTSAWEPV
jgi:choline dehydrogenase